MEPPSDYEPERLHPEALVWMVSQLDEHDHALFVDGLAKALHRLEEDRTPQATEALIAYMRRWLVSVRLETDDEWQSQIRESGKRFATGDTGESVTVEGLRKLVGLT